MDAMTPVERMLTSLEECAGLVARVVSPARATSNMRNGRSPQRASAGPATFASIAPVDPKDKVWSDDFDKYTGDACATLKALGVELPEKVQAILSEINGTMEDIRKLEDDTRTERAEHLKRAERRFLLELDHDPSKPLNPDTATSGETLMAADQRYSAIGEMEQTIEDGLKGAVRRAREMYDLLDEHIGRLDDEIEKCQERYILEKRQATGAEPPAASAPAKRRKKGKARKGTDAGSRSKKVEEINFIDEFADDHKNEPVYCMCQDAAYGDMIECSDEGCVIEWFHLECMELKSAPDGKWVCPECARRREQRRAEKKRRRGF